VSGETATGDGDLPGISHTLLASEIVT